MTNLSTRAEQPETELGRKMRELADTGHPQAEELREKAAAFDEAANGYYSEEPTVTAPKFLGCFARARRLWCDCTGEPLV